MKRRERYDQHGRDEFQHGNPPHQKPPAGEPKILNVQMLPLANDCPFSPVPAGLLHHFGLWHWQAPVRIFCKFEKALVVHQAGEHCVDSRFHHFFGTH
jgi:hypothetical protein